MTGSEILPDAINPYHTKLVLGFQLGVVVVRRGHGWMYAHVVVAG